MKRNLLWCGVGIAVCVVGLASADVFKAGGDRLVATQNADGGWDWPLLDGRPSVGNAPNILAPTAMGLLQAYQETGDPNYLDALERAGGALLSKGPYEITPDDGYFAVALDDVFAVTTYTQHVKDNFYTPLATGQYNYLKHGTLLLDTAQYVAVVRWLREREGMANLAALDCGIGLCSAALIGADTSAWVAGTKAEINELNGEDVYDVLGLAGAVLGLAVAGQDIDPAAGAHAAAGSLADLAGILAGYQLPAGGFTWNSQNMAEDAANETVQETAVAALALNVFDPNQYVETIANATAYLKRVQLPTGGWENFLEEGENNEVTGESLWAIGATSQAQATKP